MRVSNIPRIARLANIRIPHRQLSMIAEIPIDAVAHTFWMAALLLS